MHYVRLLRPPKVTESGRSHQVELLFIISTDLGDSLLYPDEPVDLAVTAHIHGPSDVLKAPLHAKGQVVWKPGQRVVKQAFRTPPVVSKALAAGVRVQVSIGPGQRHAAADSTEKLVQGDDGLIMPLWVVLDPRGEQDDQVSTRVLHMHEGPDGPIRLEIAEDIGEPKSLARHVWDGGLVTVCGLAATLHHPPPEASRGPCLQAVRDLISRSGPVNILELGCGVGVLGLGAAAVASTVRAAPGEGEGACAVLMTDLEDAEEQVRSNMARFGGAEGVDVLYENLDWEDGRRGRFGTAAASRAWDLVMFSDCTYNVDVLPALVETLSAIHAANKAHAGDGGDAVATRVFLATKPRHSSEVEVFDLLSQHGWRKLVEQTMALPVIGAEPQRVELYMFDKR